MQILSEYDSFRVHNMILFLEDSEILFIMDFKDLVLTSNPCIICSSSKADIAVRFSCQPGILMRLKVCLRECT